MTASAGGFSDTGTLFIVELTWTSFFPCTGSTLLVSALVMDWFPRRQ